MKKQRRDEDRGESQYLFVYTYEEYLIYKVVLDGNINEEGGSSRNC